MELRMRGLDATDQIALGKLRDRLVRVILASDASAYVDSYAADGIVMHPETPFVRGSAALLEYARAVFAAVKVTRLVLTTVTLDGDGDVAFEVGVQDCAIEPANEHFKDTRQYLHAYKRQSDGEWKIAAAMSGNQ
jgi:uncharacterized protein (TIGR02246 family)